LIKSANWEAAFQFWHPCGSFHDPFDPKPATRLSRKDWHSGANGAVL
jgi:hypothetical protein